LVIVGAFLHSLLTERDPFLKKQIRLSFTAPVFAGLFAIFYLLPGVLSMPPVPLTYFALLSLIIPYALPLAMDNRSLYQERLEAERKQLGAEQRAQQEKERLRENLHDIILNNLAVISRSAEVSLHHLDHDPASVEDRLQTMRDLARETSQQIREFIQVIDERYSTWEAFCAHLQRWGHETAEGFGLAFHFEMSPSLLTHPPAPVQLRVGLYLVYREAIINAVKHAHAETVQVSLTGRGDSVVCEIQDNGVGFDPAHEHPGHYGLENIRKHVHELGGDVTITAGAGLGTHITCRFPLR